MLNWFLGHGDLIASKILNFTNSKILNDLQEWVQEKIYCGKKYAKLTRIFNYELYRIINYI